MATTETVAKAWALLRRAYPDHVQKHLGNATDQKATMELYARLLLDIPDDVLEAATMHHITESQWWPKVSELRERATAIRMAAKQIPTEYEAWSQVYVNARHSDRCEWSHPLVKLAIDRLGGIKAYAFSPLEDEPSWRAQYMRCYQGLVARERETVSELPQIAAVTERLRLGAG